MTDTINETYAEALEFSNRLEGVVERQERLTELIDRIEDRNSLVEDGNEWDKLVSALEYERDDEGYGDPLDIGYEVRFNGQGSVYDWTINVLIGTGGPACGVDFEGSTDAKCWWQNWFTLKEYVTLNSETANHFWNLWGLDMIEDQINDMERG